jgi:hypothetical protein
LKIVVIDGQGGRMGKAVIEALKARCPDTQHHVIAVGTNSIATKAMLAAGADGAATGENALIVNVRDADCVIGPIGILVADSLLGEVSPAMSVAVGQSPAQKILLPVNRCNTHVVGARSGATLGDLVEEAGGLVCD